MNSWISFEVRKWNGGFNLATSLKTGQREGKRVESDSSRI